MFICNNSIHSSIDRALNELFKNYVADFAHEFENKSIKKILFDTKRAKWLRNNGKYLRELWEKIAKKQKLNYDTYHKMIKYFCKLLIYALDVLKSKSIIVNYNLLLSSRK